MNRTITATITCDWGVPGLTRVDYATDKPEGEVVPIENPNDYGVFVRDVLYPFKLVGVGGLSAMGHGYPPAYSQAGLEIDIDGTELVVTGGTIQLRPLTK